MAAPPSRIVHGDVFRRLCTAREFIRDAHGESIDLDAMSRRAGLSPFHFQRVFRHVFGESPHAYLTRVRLERAKDLLAHRKTSVTDACFEVGFASVSSFSALFQRHVGRSPAAFRREMAPLVQVPGRIGALYVPACFASWFASA